MDLVSDALCRIKTAYRAKHTLTLLPASLAVFRICTVMAARGFVDSVQWLSLRSTGMKDKIVVTFKYSGVHRVSVIKGLKRISRPGARLYLPSRLLPRLLGGLGLVIVSTSSGIMSASRAKALGIGGEVICYVW